MTAFLLTLTVIYLGFGHLYATFQAGEDEILYRRTDLLAARDHPDSPSDQWRYWFRTLAWPMFITNEVRTAGKTYGLYIAQLKHDNDKREGRA